MHLQVVRKLVQRDKGEPRPTDLAEVETHLLLTKIESYAYSGRDAGFRRIQSTWLRVIEDFCVK
jgi:hypothetical protein